MADSNTKRHAAIASPLSLLGKKVLREVLRPFHHKRRNPTAAVQQAAVPIQRHALADFNPQSCTVEPEGLALLHDLVRESSQFTGPIIEIGTLLGITATHMALVKRPPQKIITVDNYCWNPWALPANAHYA